jgi:ribonuclease P protein component
VEGAPSFVVVVARAASGWHLPENLNRLDTSTLLKPQGLPPAHRVRKRRDFERAYAEGDKVVMPEFALFARANGMDHSRLGITTTRKLGNAVTRNRARRIVREAYRTHREHLPLGLDLVFVVRSPLLQRPAEEVGPILVRATDKLPKEGSTT